MQNMTEHLSALQAEENVLLKKTVLLRQKAAHNIIQQARLNAKKQLKTAHAEAAIHHQNGYAAGYQRGLIMALDAVACYLSEHEKQTLHRYQRIEHDLQHLLKQLLNEDAVVLLAIAQWRARITTTPNNSALSLLIPESYRRLKPQLITLLNDKTDQNIRIEYHQAPYFVMRCNSQLAEFYPDVLAEEGAHYLLKQAIDAQEGASLSRDALFTLQRCIQDYVAAATPIDTNTPPSEEPDDTTHAKE